MMTEEEWQEEVRAAANALIRELERHSRCADVQFLCPNQDSIAPLRMKVQALNIVLFSGFELYDRKAIRAVKKREFTLEELFGD